MFLKNPKIRKFEYTPRFYNPDTEEEEEERRIKFRRLVERRGVQKRSVVGMLVIIIILSFLVHYLIGVMKSDKKNAPIEGLKIEIIE